MNSLKSFFKQCEAAGRFFKFKKYNLNSNIELSKINNNFFYVIIGS